MSATGSEALDSLGGAIGAKVAAHLQAAVVQARLRLGPHQAGIAQKILTDFTNHVSDEVRGVMSPLWQAIADSPDTSGWVRELAHRLGNERGQAWAWIGGSATGAAMGSGIITLLTNELQPVIGSLIAANPHIPFSPDTAAAVVSRGLGERRTYQRDAAQAGMDETRFTLLTQLTATSLGVAEILQLYARGDIDRRLAQTYFQRAGWDGHHAGEALRLARTHISLQDGAQMANRSIVSTEELRELARLGGYDPDDAARYEQLAGEPLPVQDALTALRRGIIDEARARRAWVQGPVRNEWFPTALELQYAPMSTVDAADAVNQGHLSLAQGRQVAEWNGLMGEHFDTLIENAGLPPGVELATEALNRGLLTEAQFEQAFLESRLKNRYVSLYKALRYRVMPPETVRRLYRSGALTLAQATERLGWAGFSPEDSAAQLSTEDTDTTSGERDLTASEIVALYTDRAVGEDSARSMLTDIGYSAGAVEWKLALAELRRSRRHMDAVIARVRAGYVAGRLPYEEVVTVLDRLRVPADQREDLVGLWDLERASLTKGLTVAQVQAAVRRGLLTPDDGYAEMLTQGYSERDAGILIELAVPAAR